MRRPVGVKSILFCWTRCFLQPSRHCRHPSIRTLDERLSLGASWAFSFQPVLPPDCRPVFLFAEKVGQAINAVTGTRLVDLVFPFSECFDFMPPPASLSGCYCARVRRLLRSPTNDVARLLTFSPSQSRLVSFRSFRHARPVSGPTV